MLEGGEAGGKGGEGRKGQAQGGYREICCIQEPVDKMVIFIREQDSSQLPTSPQDKLTLLKVNLRASSKAFSQTVHIGREKLTANEP